MTTTTIDERAQQEAEEERLEYQLHLLTKVWEMEGLAAASKRLIRPGTCFFSGTAKALAAELGILEHWNKELEKLYAR